MTEKASVTHELIKPFETFAFPLTCLNGVFKLFLYQNCRIIMAFHSTFDTIIIAVDERQKKHPSFSF